MLARLFNLLSVFAFAILMTLTACTNNTDDATNASDTEKHGTMEEQIDSGRAAQPIQQGVDTPHTVDH